MRKIDTRDFHVATRTTPREVNRQIALNLVREHEPISRADLARRMGVVRSALTHIVRDLLASGAVVETAERAVDGVRSGRPPTLLRAGTSRVALAVDVRPRHTALALASFAGVTVARDALVTPDTAAALVDALAERIATMLAAHDAAGACQGVGVVVPGVVDRQTGRIVYSPLLDWRDADVRDALAARVGLPVATASTPAACALARLWLAPDETRAMRNFAYVHVSDGVGTGLVVDGEVLGGATHTAGEFGHISLDPRGPVCTCGRRGCWEAYASNAATMRRYAERGGVGSTVADVVGAARRGHRVAVAALAETGTLIGRGLANVVNAFSPGLIYLGGEVTAAWDLLERPIRSALAEGALTTAGGATPVVPDPRPGEYRLLGAIALIAGPTFAAPRVG